MPQPTLTERQDGAGFTNLLGDNGEGDLFVMARDGVQDLIRNFERGLDRIDLTALGATSRADLDIRNETRPDGAVKWVQVALTGERQAEFKLRFSDGTPLDAGSVGADDFVFADVSSAPPVSATVDDTPGFDNLRGTGLPELFVFGDDGVRDLLRDFDPGVDAIDVSAFASSIDDLMISNLERRDGSVNWVAISDQAGEMELAVRFVPGVTLDASAMGADSFVFADGPVALPQPPSNTITDGAGFDRLAGTDAADVFVMSDDGVRDHVRGFEVGVDRFDLSGFGADLTPDDVIAVNLERRDGSVNWVEIYVDAERDGIQDGEAPDFILRCAAGTDLDAALLGSDFLV